MNTVEFSIEYQGIEYLFLNLDDLNQAISLLNTDVEKFKEFCSFMADIIH